MQNRQGLLIAVTAIVSWILGTAESLLQGQPSFHARRKVLSRDVKSGVAASTQTTESATDQNPVFATARFVAVKALIPKLSGPSFAIDRLQTDPMFSALSIRDRSFCRLLVAATERRMGQVDKILKICQNEQDTKKKKKFSHADALVQATLRVGATQLLFLDVPAYAAVKETVQCLRMNPKVQVPESKVKYTNAVLRRLSREGKQLLEEHTNVSDNASAWLVDQWSQSWGTEITKKILDAAMKESPRCLTVRRSKPGSGVNDQVEKVAALFDGSEILPQGSIKLLHPPGDAISTWPLYEEGAWWVQDPSATIPAIALYESLRVNGEARPVSEMHVIDLCASPGGKTAQLSNYGFASVTAVELSQRRVKRLEQNRIRLRMDWNVVQADGKEWVPDQAVDGILVDVPCTATGTASKRPDVLMRDENITALLETQFELACNAADKMLNLNGILMYSTCSLLRQEGEEQVQKLLDRTDGAKLRTIPFQPGEIPGFDDAIDENGWIRVFPGTLPHGLDSCDGFFVARIQKIA